MQPARVDAARERPEAYIARDRRRALAEGRSMPDRVVGAALFADVSGFTPLTEQLAVELGPHRGAEELTAHLERVFHALIEELDRRGGEVIYFSGDAITCWLDGDDGARAVATALAMQEAMARHGRVVTPAGAEVPLALKVAVAVGAARRFVVGDPELQLVDVLAGTLIDHLAEAEQLAEKGEVLADRSALEAMAGRITTGARRRSASGRTVAVVESLTVEVPTTTPVEPPPLDEELVRPWILPAVYERVRAGDGEFLAELRPASPLFLRFTGIDFDHDPEAVGKLDAFIRAVQRVMAAYDGNVLQLTLGDKGAYLYGAFGAPVAHEDDAARAAAAALDLRALEGTTAARGISIGVTRGRLWSGTYGHARRRTFVCMGDAVNLAARLMTAAPPGSIYVEEAARREAGDAYHFEPLPDLRVKGKQRHIRAHRLVDRAARAERADHHEHGTGLIGRAAELRRLEEALDAALDRHRRIVGIAAEAGMGKSRLITEFATIAAARGAIVARGECQAFGANASYFVWREVAPGLLGLEGIERLPDPAHHVAEAVAAVDPALAPRAPLLGAVLGLDLPDSELTASFDAKLRKASLEDLVTRLVLARAEQQPAVVVLEDCHWIDPLSRDLLEAVARTTSAAPILYLLAYRPAAQAGGDLGIERIPGFDEIALDALPEADAAVLVRERLAHLVGTEGGQVPEPLVSLVHQRSEGNPLYIEELVAYLVERGVDLHDPNAAADLDLPDSLHSLVLSRIDALPEDPRRTIKVASVVGRTFEAPILPGAYPELGTLDAVRVSLESARAADLVVLDREDALVYLFKHVATQEVAYASLPFATRRRLHRRIGLYLEASDAQGAEHRLDLLAHHFWQSDDEERKRIYLRRAADAARARYANEAAIDYLEKLIPLIEGETCVDAHLRLVEVLHVIGEVTRAEAVATRARALAESLGDQRRVARADYLIGESLRRTSRFDEAAERLQAAYEGFEACGDQAGMADVLQVTGTLNAQRGDTAVARAKYLEGLAIRQRLGDEAGVAALTNNLGIVAQQEGDGAAARQYAERALELYSRIGDRRRIAACHINLAWMDGMAGDHESARERCELAFGYANEVGDPLNQAIAQNNLGDALRELGRLEEAGEAYAAAVERYCNLGDRGPLMALLEDVAVLASRRGDHAAAYTLLGAADALREALGAPRPSSAEVALEQNLAASRRALGATADALRRDGAGLTLDEATERAVAAARGMALA